VAPGQAPEPDPLVEPFRDGLGELRLNDELAGHVATSVGEFWSPGRPLRRQWWVWLVVVWADGTRERSREDYPPWTYVTEMTDGYFTWEESDVRYDFRWLPASEAQSQRDALGIKSEHF
jgi:hypothetical protein